MPSFLLLFLVTSALSPPSSATTTAESFVYGGCSQTKYTSGSTYESNLNSILTSLINSASFTLYTNSTVAGAGDGDTVYGLFQCRGDFQNAACAKCVAHAVAQLGSICLDACGGALQLEGCFVKYDNVSFLGVEDKTVVVKKCGAVMGYDSGGWARRDAVLAYLAAADGSGGGYQPFRVGGSGDVQGVAQCVGDLDAGECQDCVVTAVGRLKAECAAAGWGDVFLGKCYARFSHGGIRPHGGGGGNDGRNTDVEIEKTLAVIIGLIAGIAFIVVFLAFLSHYCEKRKGNSFHPIQFN
ncbi:cysteine-rich repeat secretory protein 12-like isoform X1 [Cucurbita pepo subsp. pepo]|uniref:cysteine-rich repeat secretory protein 12-like isoform X1 n=1 Tax=Cucurbita pepo subsp. pepo TaxID=3664 RepID=UPI000C9D6F3B|nr:cysteine-rich repeat secretory protein 12-like isoform X1 [Cucurbita pepo subsp. pepo]